MMAVQQLIRSLQYCTVNNANTDIKIRQVEVPYTDSKGELHRRWVVACPPRETRNSYVATVEACHKVYKG
jgi:hypothetical protein